MNVFKPFRIIILALFIIVFLAFVYSFIQQHKDVDKTLPVITVPEETLDVPLDAKNEDFLAGVTAYDEKDGDLTDRIMVESVSKFIDIKRGLCRVTFAVSDSDRHVASASRKVHFVGYKSPKFSASRSLCYSIYEAIDLSTAIHAKDKIEGDLSSNVVITSSNFESGLAGSYSIVLKLTTEKGDTITEEIPLIVEDRPLNAPTIELKDYLIYHKLGESINLKSYLVSAIDAMDEKLTEKVNIASNLDVNKPGIYTVNYYATDALSRTGHSVLVVIVR